MSIFNRIGRVVQANLNSLLDGAEDPDAVIAQTLGDMEDGIRDARKDLISARGAEKRLLDEATQHDAEAKRWEERAALALRSNDEDLAKQALAQKLSAAKEATRVRTSAGQHGTAASQLEQAIERLEARRQELDARKGTLAAQVRAARTQPSQHGSPAPSAVTKMDSMTTRIDAMEAELEAASVLEDPARADLEARFNALEAGAVASDVDDQLAALKRRLDGEDSSDAS